MKRLNWPLVTTIAIGAATLVALAALDVVDAQVVSHLLTAVAAWLVKAPNLTKETK